MWNNEVVKVLENGTKVMKDGTMLMTNGVRLSKDGFTLLPSGEEQWRFNLRVRGCYPVS